MRNFFNKCNASKCLITQIGGMRRSEDYLDPKNQISLPEKRGARSGVRLIDIESIPDFLKIKLNP